LRVGARGRRRVPIRITLAEGRVLRARLSVVCRRAPRGVRHVPPAPLVP
jgi:hypothetical protein